MYVYLEHRALYPHKTNLEIAGLSEANVHLHEKKDHIWWGQTSYISDPWTALISSHQQGIRTACHLKCAQSKEQYVKFLRSGYISISDIHEFGFALGSRILGKLQ